MPSTPTVANDERPVRWRLCLLGSPRLETVGGERRIELRPKDAALLALVALAGPIQADRLTALLWPTASAPRAEASLRQRTFRLRRDSAATLVASGALLQLASDLAVDLPSALQAIADDPAAGRAELLGDLGFDDLPDLSEWVSAERTKWRAQRNDAVAAAAARCERNGELARALEYAQVLVESDPLAEHAQRRLMRLHYLRGDGASAIGVFERFERRLKEELGTRPSAESIELLKTIEQGAGRLPVRRSIAPASLLRPPRVIGRERELAALEHAWSAHKVFLLVGEAGLGKSRLIQEFAADRAGVVSVQARPGDAGMAYALLARLLRGVRALPALQGVLEPTRARELALVLPELGHAVVLAGEAQRLLLHRAVEATLADAVAQGLTALIVDDLHFADDASLEFLQSLVQSDSLATLQWGFAQRPAENTGSGVARVRHALEEAGRAEPLHLGALTQPHLLALLDSLAVPELAPARLAPALFRHTGGNPLFVLETLKDLLLSGQAGALEPGDPLPRPVSVTALVERRLARLSPAALRLARVAALAGADFNAELASRVLEQHPVDITEPWRELESAHVIRDGAFAHDLILEATRASVPTPIAQLLHRQIARYLQQMQAQPERLAPHWAGAAQWQEAGEAYAAGARRARNASQRTHEVDCWRLATEAFEKAGAPAQAFEARCESIHALIVVQGVTHANAVIDTLLAGARTDPERAAALTAKATASLMAADHQAGIAAAVQATALTRRFESPWPGFQAARLHAVGLAQAGHPAQALAIIEPYRTLIEDSADPEQRGRFWADYAYVLNGARRLRDTGFALQQAIANAESIGDIAELATLTSNLATVRGNLGQIDDALALARRSMALQARLGATDGPEGAVVQTYAALYGAMVGHYAEALQHLDSALACFERDRQRIWFAVASNHKAQILIDLGQFARARQALAYETPPLAHVAVRGATIACRLARALGHDGQAPLRQALQALTPGADPHVRMHLMLEQAQGDDPDTATARCDEVLEQALRLEFAGVAMKARFVRADAARRAGHADEAAGAMRDLVDELDRLQPADMMPSQAWWLAAQVFDASGDGAHASIALGRGAHWLRQIALPHVPPEFRDSFLQRNAANRALLAAADRRLVQ